MATERKYIGKYLRRFREAFKLKQNKVAAAVGLAPQMYIKYEKDQMSPSVTLVINLANEFNVSADYLLGLSDEPRPQTFDRETTNLLKVLEAWKDSRTPTAPLPQPAATA
ncbi:MAG: helix-turn-helix transcriptional regulator [Selenomonadaceae bacterium]|nr:helix-turn-helix transcriptional regulator [Selenomonadaceae bacterium]